MSALSAACFHVSNLGEMRLSENDRAQEISVHDCT